ncbi:diguanylate cyclase domain-containing protein [Massilia sp. H6]|uniref:sensor domain-containing protein n=1 Tax=Massilia sp. H6 TaxID=2970464 RepID=UPI00216AAFF0|nr:diguanylate cyclase [Massilia sp. H6]UVW27836.1 diguanylate cyclase [Massilia sp. H6]
MDPASPIPIASIPDLLLDAVCLVDARGRFVFVNAACERIFGYTPQEMVGKSMIDMVAPADRERTLAAAQAVMDGREHVDFENRYVRKDGTLVHLMWSARWSEPDQLRVAVARDVTLQRRAGALREALDGLCDAALADNDMAGLFRRSHALIGTLLPAASVVLALPEGPEPTLRFVFQGGQRVPEGGALRRLCDDAFHSNAAQWREPGTDDACGQALALPLAGPAGAIGAIGVLALRNPATAARFTEADCALLAPVAQQLAVAIQRNQEQARLHFLAMHDDLTGLPNRRLLRERLDAALARARRQQAMLALLFIDLDRFKQINDQHGHACGDRLLQQVAARIGAAVRDTDTVARIGGDEFVVLLEDIASTADADAVAGKIHAALALSFDLGDGIHLPVGASIGSAHYPGQADAIDSLLDAADAAMYAAKARRKAAAGCA